MIAALIILAALVIVGGILYLHHKLTNIDNQPIQTTDIDVATTDSSECCGMHIICKKESLLPTVDETIVYYDDEELDEYKGRSADSYDDVEIEQFRDVLLTLLPQDIAGWGRSIHLRGIELPVSVREELLMIVAEARQQL